MGLSRQTTGTAVFSEPRQERPRKGRVIALAGNPNVGKSTVFNALTGLNQHTGNWPGKTVVNAEGYYRYGEKDFTIVDLPGTYSLLANSVEEEVARDFICFGGADATVIVADATALERNLNRKRKKSESIFRSWQRVWASPWWAPALAPKRGWARYWPPSMRQAPAARGNAFISIIPRR